MSEGGKRVAVVVATRDRERATEALRAAVGLGLRGDEVSVAFADTGTREAAEADGAASKALSTLEVLGRRVAGPGELAALVAGADAVEVWT